MRDKEDKDGRWCVAVANLVKDAKFHSKDYDLLRASLDELQEVRIIRPRRSGGVTSEVLIPSFTLDNVSHEGNEEMGSGQKKRGGHLMLWFMISEGKLFHHDRHSIMPLWSRAPSVVRAFGDKPSGEGVGRLPEPGAAGVGELAAPY